jgi:chromosome segregation ATPase
MNRIATMCVLILAGAWMGTAWRGEVAAQAPAAQTDILPALLIEVRGLRAAMEQMASAGPRVQLALGRVQLQEQRVSGLSRRLETASTNAAEAERNYERQQQQLQGIEESVPQATGPTAVDLKAMQAQIKIEMGRAAADLQRFRAEEAGLASELATEQARWTELNQQMEALEGTLVRR